MGFKQNSNYPDCISYAILRNGKDTHQTMAPIALIILLFVVLPIAAPLCGTDSRWRELLRGARRSV